MTYGTLAFQRYKYTGVRVTDKGESRYVDRETAEKNYAKTVTDPAERAYQRELEKQRKARLDFAHSAVIHDPPTTRKERKLLAGAQQVTLDGTVHTVAADAVERFIQKEANKRYPDPKKPELVPFASWFLQRSEDRRVWRAWFITAGTTEPVTEEIDVFGSHGFPIDEAMQQLNSRKQEGWRLVHVSEDHGLYQGADSSDEAYLTRVRYLLEKD